MSYASQSGFEKLKQIVAEVAELSKVESPPKMEGRTMMTIVAPIAPKRKPDKQGKPEKSVGRAPKQKATKTEAPTEKQEEG